jgi:hypothetical protein
MADFLSLFGLPVSIAVAFAAIFGGFQLLESVASPTKKADLSNFLRSADWAVLPHKITSAFRDAFETIFDKRHFSAKCLRRSVLFSALAILILFAVGFLKNYEYFRTMPAFVMKRPSYQIVLFSWLAWSVLFDYVNLYKTRLLIRLIDSSVAVPVLIFFIFVILDLIFSFEIFDMSQNAFQAMSMAYQACGPGALTSNGCTAWEQTELTFRIFLINVKNLNWTAVRLISAVLGPTTNEMSTFFWSGLLPTLWLLLYVVATAVTRYLVKISSLVSATVAWLDVDKPFQLIGFVAGFIVGLLMVTYDLIAIMIHAS